jgi:hypothetical protein
MSTVNINTSNNTVSIQDTNQTISVIDNNKNTTVYIPQTNTNIVEVNSLGPQGIQGEQGIPGTIPNTGSFATTGSNIFLGNQIVTGSLFTTGSNTLIGSTTLSGTLNISGSTTQTGNNTLIGTTTLTGSIFINGDIIPEVSKSFNLGSITNPWRSIYLQSGSISIQSDTPGGIPAIISNANGDVTIAGAGFQIKSGSSTPFNIMPTGLITINTPKTLLTTETAVNIIGSSTGYQQPRNFTGTLLQLTAQDNQSGRISIDSFGTGVYGLIAGRTARGTVNSPSQSKAGDTLFRITAQGWTNSSSFVGSIVRADWEAAEDFTSTSAGTRLRFQTTPTGSTTIQTSAIIDTTGITIPSTSRFFGTASWAENALTASYVNPLRQDVVITGSLSISGSTTYRGSVIYAQYSSIQYLPRVIPDSSPTSSITLDFSRDTLVHVHCTGFSTFTVNVTNFTTGSIVELYLTNNAGSTQVNMPGSISSNNLIGKNGAGSFWSMSRPSGYFKFICIDGTAANTFVIGSVN